VFGNAGEQVMEQNKLRFITAASLFDGHDASINIMRRIFQAHGVEVIHLGHNRSVEEIVRCAIQEDANAIAITSYQGGHVEYLSFMYDLLKQNHCSHIKIIGGGGGTILPSEIEVLHKHGIERIYSPDDGRSMGLEGMIKDAIQRCNYSTMALPVGPTQNTDVLLARIITYIENSEAIPNYLWESLLKTETKNAIVIGLTGTGGAGKSSITDEIIRRFSNDYPDKKFAILSVDPSRKKTGGALLGDRIRMNSIYKPNIYMRSIATREDNLSINKHLPEIISVVKKFGYDFIFVETAGIGQSDTSITEFSDILLYAMTPEYGAATQLEKIGMLDYADFVIVNKCDKRGALDAVRDVAKQYQRNKNLFHQDINTMPVYSCIASKFNDHGINKFYIDFLSHINTKYHTHLSIPTTYQTDETNVQYIIPPKRYRYLAEIVEDSDKYKQWIESESLLASKLYRINGVLETSDNAVVVDNLKTEYKSLYSKLSDSSKEILEKWNSTTKQYREPFYSFYVREKEIKLSNYFETLSGLRIPKVFFPKYKDWGDILRWAYTENFPGEFPFTAGVYPFKRTEEDPIRMFAGEGGPERTNKRFHYLSTQSSAIRLSTAFDSVTLYGEDPATRPDIYGKIGNSGVSVASLDDAKRLYSGFDLVSPTTSVSMTINGPAPMLLAYFFHVAIDQQCEKYIKQNGLTQSVEKKIHSMFNDKGFTQPTYRAALPDSHNKLGLLLLGLSGKDVLEQEVYENIKKDTLSKVRGTVQADILKEDQAQNTCIFSTEFALHIMGDIQKYFIDHSVKNFYSVSISGYHIAEAGANPITQLAFTLANGFTYIEYYLSRGMSIDLFAPNFSFFFSNGMEIEYGVIGRVARRIWAKAMKNKYNGNTRSQMLKYHIQTSGRSLHAQEIDFNDIRTTLQALYALYDNCNSLHTNAYDEAITTPTEGSVRRAVAIQMIINKELGTMKTENFLQGSFVIEELTDLVEEAVYAEFHRISERGGVLAAMETMYQRNKIQEESMYYEGLKISGKYPIIGVNTFLSKEGSPTVIPSEVIRSTEVEKQKQIQSIADLHKFKHSQAETAMLKLKEKASKEENIFETLMEVAPTLSLGQISHALYDVGGQYRRNM
jgi:isobutyryl-CoA mutase